MKAHKAKPNVIIIVADDMGFGDLGAFNDGLVDTPALNRLAAEGVCFSQHYSGSPICSPARASLLTGRYPHRTGAITQHDLFGLDRIALREATLADTFAVAGYRTGLVGKWHNGSMDARFEPNARGFHEFAGFCGGWSDYYDWNIQRNGVFSKSDGTYLTDLLTSEAMGFVRRNKDEPFFLMLAYSAPHSPFQAPQPLIDKYLAKGLTRTTATTYGMIEVMDSGIGDILTLLEDLSIAENTIVMFTSDNGPAFFNPRFMLKEGEADFQERFNSGLRGSKGWVYDGGIRVLMILRYPAMIEGGFESFEVLHFNDWLPTLASLCDVPIVSTEPLDGYDVSGVLQGEQSGVAPIRFWQWNYYYPDIGTNAAMRDGDWKLVRPMISGTRFYGNPELIADEFTEARTNAFIEADIKHVRCPEEALELLPIPNIQLPSAEPLELFNLANDPGETKNLANAYPDRVHRMKMDLESWFERVERDRTRINDPLHQVFDRAE